jgi:transcription initiation factor IIE alpha subunit
MNISGVALKVLIYVALEEHEITREKIHHKVTEDIYDINKAIEELLREGLISVHKVTEEDTHYWIFAISIEGRHFIGYLGRELRAVYVP